jgi:hypothetical protein
MQGLDLENQRSQQGFLLCDQGFRVLLLIKLHGCVAGVLMTIMTPLMHFFSTGIIMTTRVM